MILEQIVTRGGETEAFLEQLARLRGPGVYLGVVRLRAGVELLAGVLEVLGLVRLLRVETGLDGVLGRRLGVMEGVVVVVVGRGSVAGTCAVGRSVLIATGRGARIWGNNGTRHGLRRTGGGAIVGVLV